VLVDGSQFSGEFGQLVDTPTPAILSSHLQRQCLPMAGEKFFAWIKSCNFRPAPRWSKKFISAKTIVKSGENAFRRKVFSGWHRRC
jgi:hypothetical protein